MTRYHLRVSYRRRAGLIAVLAGGLIACERPTQPQPPPWDRVLWRVYRTGYGQAVFDSTSVYFVGIDHDLIAVDKNAGRERWRQTSGESGSITVGQTAAIAGDIVAFGDVDVYAYDRSSGVLRWDFRPAEASQPGYLGISGDRGAIYAGSPFGYVYALDAATGNVRWTARLPSDSNAWMSHPIASQGAVFVCVTHKTNPYSGAVAAFDAASGNLLWLREYPAQARKGEAGCYAQVTLTKKYVLAPSDNGFVYAIDRQNGTIVWTVPPEVDSPVMAVFDSLVFIATPTGYVRAHRADTGVEIWRATANFGSIVDPLAADSQHVYAVHAGGQLFAFNSRDGKIDWEMATGTRGEYYYTPAVDVDRIYIGGFHGLYALRKH